MGIVLFVIIPDNPVALFKSLETVDRIVTRGSTVVEDVAARGALRYTESSTEGDRQSKNI